MNSIKVMSFAQVTGLALPTPRLESIYTQTIPTASVKVNLKSEMD
jgi:hypothetical protein